MSPTRTLKVFIEPSEDAEYTIIVDGDIKQPENYNEVSFSFNTKTSFYGGIKTIIKVYSGEVKLKKCYATYPAIINDVPGTITMTQPMKTPFAILSSSGIECVPIERIIPSGESFEYEHLLFNGPSNTNVTIENVTQNLNEDLFIGDVLTGDVIDGITDIDYEFEYENVKPHNIWKPEHFEILKNYVLERQA